MTRTSRIGTLLVLQLFTAAAYAQNKIEPIVTGTLSSFQGQPAVNAGVGGIMQSFCNSTEIRRGIAEFIIPSLPGHVIQATLVLPENRFYGGFPMPPDTHQLGYYAGDLVLDRDDFYLPTTPITTFTTDFNEPPTIIRLDVTSAVQAYEGKVLGLRVEPLVCPSFGDSGFESSGLGRLQIEIRRGIGPRN